MKILLLANVGNSDLRLSNERLLPKQEDPRWWHATRRLGEEVRDNLNRYKRSIKLALLGPTLKWLIEELDLSERDVQQNLQVVLFASNQTKDRTPEEEYLKDTFPVAEAIRGLLSDPDAFAQIVTSMEHKIALSKKNIFLRSIEGNPSDYANMLGFYSRVLPQVEQYVDDQTRVYMEVSGGTPAMASMLILMGVEVLGDQVQTLYLYRGDDEPSSVAVARELHARRARATLCTQVNMHGYAVALETMRQNGRLILPNETQRDLLAALLSYADRRLAFDFGRARDELRRAQQLTTGDQQALLQAWRRELRPVDDATSPPMNALLGELIHSIDIKLQLGDYADTVQRIFRFQESAFHYMATRMGMPYSDPQRADRIDQEWLDRQTSLQNYLKNYRRKPDGTIKPNGGTTVIDIRGRSLNRYNLGALVEYYVTHDERWQHWRDVVEQLFQLSKLADLRNEGLAGHGFTGIGQADMEAAFGQPIDSLLAFLASIFEGLFGDQPSDNPYTAINDLILGLVEPSA